MYECFPLILKSCAREDSTKALLEPNRAIIHIQKIAPGPPTVMAVATPARFPVPTRLANEMVKAWNEEICFSCPLILAVESPNRRIISPNIRNCTNRVRILNQIAHPNNMTIRV